MFVEIESIKKNIDKEEKCFFIHSCLGLQLLLEDKKDKIL